MTQPIVLNTREVAERVKVTPRQVQRLVNKGALPVYGRSETGGYMFKVSAVNKFLRTRA